MSVVLATAGYDHKIRFWEAPSGICSRIIKFSDSQVNRLEITPDKQFIAAAGNPIIRLYEITTSNTTNTTSTSTNNNNNNNPGTNNNNNSNQYNINMNPNDYSNNNNNTNQPPTQKPVLTLEGHTGNVTSLGFQKDGRYLYTGSEDGTIKIWDLRNPNYSRSFNCYAPVNSVTLRQDRDELISGDQNGYVKIWDLGGSGGISSNNTNGNKNSNGPMKGSSKRTNGSNAKNSNQYNTGLICSIQPAKVNPTPTTTNTKTNENNRLIQNKNTINTNNRTHNNKQYNYRYTEGIAPIQSVDISKDSRTLVTITNHGTVFVWDPSNSGAIAAAAAAAAAANQNEYHHDNYKMNRNSSTNNHMNMNNNNSSFIRSVTKFRATDPGIYCLHGKIAPDCRHLVTTASDGTAKLWDTVTWELTQTLDHHQHNNNNQQQNQNNTQNNTQQQNSSSVMEQPTGTSPPTANSISTTTSKWVWDAAFCADSSYLVTACSDHVARLWSLRTGEVVRQYHGHPSAVTCVALNDCSI